MSTLRTSVLRSALQIVVVSLSLALMPSAAPAARGAGGGGGHSIGGGGHSSGGFGHGSFGGGSFSAPRMSAPPAGLGGGGRLSAPSMSGPSRGFAGGRTFSAPESRVQAPIRTAPNPGMNWRVPSSEPRAFAAPSGSRTAGFPAPPMVRSGSAWSGSPSRIQPETWAGARGLAPTGRGNMGNAPARIGRGGMGQMPNAGRSVLPVRSGPTTGSRSPGSQMRLPVTSSTPQMQQQTQRNLQTFMRDSNPRGGRSTGGASVRHPAGKGIPSGTRFLDRKTINGVNTSFSRVQHFVGQPTNRFVVRPRSFFSGHRGFRHRGFDLFFAFDFFYPFYFNDPFFYGFNYPGYYPSIYSYYGWCPGWVYPDRVYYDSSDYVYHNPYRYYYSNNGMDYNGAEQAINDIRQAWLNSDLSLLSAHLTDQVGIRVYFDGQYKYTTATGDYYAMTSDTMSTTHTESMDLGDPVWISSQEVFYTGRHEFTDPDGSQRTVYVSYRLRHLGSGWYIVGIGTSTSPIQSHYGDFREK